MSVGLQSWLQLAVLVVVILATMLHIDKRFDGLESSLNKRIDGQESSLNKRIDDLRSEMNHRFDDLVRYLDARFSALHERIERLEHPVERGR